LLFSNYNDDFSLPVISPGTGKRPVSDRENIRFPSAITSNIPLEPSISTACIPGVLFSSSARPAAC